MAKVNDVRASAFHVLTESRDRPKGGDEILISCNFDYDTDEFTIRVYDFDRDGYLLRQQHSSCTVDRYVNDGWREIDLEQDFARVPNDDIRGMHE